jgi:hypothetical protein
VSYRIPVIVFVKIRGKLFRGDMEIVPYEVNYAALGEGGAHLSGVNLGAVTGGEKHPLVHIIMEGKQCPGKLTGSQG